MRVEKLNTALHRPGIQGFFKLYNEKNPEIWRKFMKVKNTKNVFDRIYQESSFDLPAIIEQGQSFPVDDISTPYTMDVTPLKRALRFIVSDEAAESEQYGLIASRKEKMAKVMKEAREQAAANVFNNCTSTSIPYVGPDAVALLSTAHPLKNGTTVSNRGVASTDVALSYANLASMIQEMAATVNHRGNPMPIMGPYVLLYPTELSDTANRLAGGDKLPFSADNDKNWAGGQIMPVMDPWLTSATAWFLIDKDVADVYFLNRGALEVRQWADNMNHTLVTDVSEIYVTFAGGWRGVHGTTGA